MKKILSISDILRAYDVLKDAVTHTPLQFDEYLSKKFGAKIYLKREDMQKVRSFKLRGAYNAISRLPKDVLKNGVVCASAGNHAQGVAYTCNKLRTKAVIFMPSTTPAQKISQVAFFGAEFAEIKLFGDTFDDSANEAKSFAKANNMAFIAPFDDPDVIAGQGSLAVEIFKDAKEQNLKIDAIICAVGGGGLISGVGAYAKLINGADSENFENFSEFKLPQNLKNPKIQVIGVEPLGAPSMQTALENGKPMKLEKIDKFVDGAAVAQVGNITLAHAQKFVDKVISVAEGQVCASILELYSKQAIIAEPAGAIAIAALENLKDEIKGKNVVCVLSGGNNDINRMNEIEARALIFQGLMNYFIIHFPQRAGALREFVSEVLGENDDILRFEYVKKLNSGVGPAVIGVLSKKKDDVPKLLKRIEKFDKNFIQINENRSLFQLLV